MIWIAVGWLLIIAGVFAVAAHLAGSDTEEGKRR